MEKQHLFEPYGSDDGSDGDGHHGLHREDDSLLPIPHDSQPSIMFNSNGETQQYSSRRKTHRHKVISGILIVPISIVPLSRNKLLLLQNICRMLLCYYQEIL